MKQHKDTSYDVYAETSCGSLLDWRNELTFEFAEAWAIKFKRDFADYEGMKVFVTKHETFEYEGEMRDETI